MYHIDYLDLAKRKSFRFVPEGDITSYELAVCLPPLLAAISGEGDAISMIEALPINAKRHFQEILSADSRF